MLKDKIFGFMLQFSKTEHFDIISIAFICQPNLAEDNPCVRVLLMVAIMNSAVKLSIGSTTGCTITEKAPTTYRGVNVLSVS